MTGRHVYDRWTDSLAENKTSYGPWPERMPVAWAFLPRVQKDTWNTLAKKLTSARRR